MEQLEQQRNQLFAQLLNAEQKASDAKWERNEVVAKIQTMDANASEEELEQLLDELRESQKQLFQAQKNVKEKEAQHNNVMEQIHKLESK